MSESETPNSIFFLDLEGASGTVNLIHALPNQRLILKHVSVTFTSQATSDTNGELLNVSLSFFSHVRINSNRSRQIESLPIMNNVAARTTQYSPDIEIDTDSNTNMMADGVLNTLSFRQEPNTLPFYGKTKELGYYDTALTDEELETLTSYRSLNEMVTELNLNAL